MPPDHPPPFPPRPPLRPAATGRRSGRALLECSDGGRSFEVNRATAQFRSRLPFHAGARADAQARLQGSSSDLRQGHMDSLKGTRITGALFRSRITTSESAVHFDAPLPEPGEQAMLPPKICLPSSTDAFLHSLRRMDLAHPRPPCMTRGDLRMCPPSPGTTALILPPLAAIAKPKGCSPSRGGLRPEGSRSEAPHPTDTNLAAPPSRNPLVSEGPLAQPTFTDAAWCWHKHTQR